MNAEDYYLKYGVTPMNTKYDKDAKIFDYFTLIDFAEQYAEVKIKTLNEPTTEADTSKANLTIPGVNNNEERVAVCSHPKQYRRVDIDRIERCDLCNQITN